MKIRVGNIDAVLGTYQFFIGECQYIAGVYLDRSIFDLPNPELGALQITKDTDIIRLLLVYPANMFDDLFFVIMSPMRKIQPEYIYTCFYKFKKLVISITGRTNSCYNFCSMKSVFKTCFFIHLFVQVPVSYTHLRAHETP